MPKFRLAYMNMSYKKLGLYPLDNKKPLNGFKKEHNNVTWIITSMRAV